MAAMKTPGVYIVEKNAFPNSVVEVATAVPAFIGYTEKAINGNKSLLNKPWKISSMAEFQNYFGGAPTPQFIVKEGKGTDGNTIHVNNKDYTLKRNDKFTLYYHIMLFFANGGGPCYIVSVGPYQYEEEQATKDEKGQTINIKVIKTTEITAKALTDGITPLIKEQEPTMLVIPEAIKLAMDECYTLQQAMLDHCGYKMRNRFAILDVYDGFRDRKDPKGDMVNKFREQIGSSSLDFCAAYYPWLQTSVVQESELSFLNIQDQDTVKAIDYFKLNFYEEQGITDESFIKFCKDNNIIPQNNTEKSITKIAEELKKTLEEKRAAADTEADHK